MPRQRLAELGDLAPDTLTPARYKGLLVNAVQAFQLRHGLATDGVIGKATLAQLQVTPASRVRQRPGPKNALGDIKFVFPNHDNIYLHHTPITQLFERDRRDFSHGCIRVEHPVALAKFVLQGMPNWTDDRIRQAMNRGESATLRLAEPVPVLIAYGTALIKEGRIFFYEDIYGLDRLLDAALRKHSEALDPTHGKSL